MEEARVFRNLDFQEHRVHTLLYFIEPSALGLKHFDIEFMRHVAPFVSIIPVMAKADGLNELERKLYKKKVNLAKIMAKFMDELLCYIDYGRY